MPGYRGGGGGFAQTAAGQQDISAMRSAAQYGPGANDQLLAAGLPTIPGGYPPPVAYGGNVIRPGVAGEGTAAAPAPTAYGVRTGFGDPHNVFGGANLYGYNPPVGGAFGHSFAHLGPFPGNLGFGWGRGPQTYDPSAFLNRGFGLFGHGAFHPGGFGGFGAFDRFNRYGGGGLMAGLGRLFGRFGAGGFDRGAYGGYRGWGPGAGQNIGGYLGGGYGFNQTGTPTGPYGSNYTPASAFVDNNQSTVTNFDPGAGGTGLDFRR